MSDEEILKIVREHEDAAAAKAERLHQEAQQAESTFRAMQRLRYKLEQRMAKPTQAVKGEG